MLKGKGRPQFFPVWKINLLFFAHWYPQIKS